MKTRTRILILIFALSFILLGFPAPAGAMSPEYFRLDVDMWATGEDSAAGDFVISGLFADTGTVSEIFFIAGNTSHGLKTLVSTQGTITIKYQVQLTWTQTQGIAVGRFTIISGTGAYANLHGIGETYATLDLATYHLVGSYIGTAHFD